MAQIVNAEAEIQAILTCLEAPSKEIKTACLGRLTEGMFGYVNALTAFQCLKKYTAELGSIPSRNVFENYPELTVEARTTVNSTTIVPVSTFDDLDHLVGQLEEMRRLRTAHSCSFAIAKSLQAEKVESADLLEVMESSLMELRSSDNHAAQMFHVGEGGNSKELMKKIMSQEDTSGFIPTGFKNFDSKTKGFRRKQMAVIASHYKGGKSVVALNILKNQYFMYGLKVCHIVLEGGEELAFQRKTSLVSGIPFEKIYQKKCALDDLQHIDRAWKAFDRHGVDKKCRFSTWCPVGYTLEEMEIFLKPLGYDVICIDYVNLLPSEAGSKRSQNDAGEISTLTKRIKLMGERLDCVTIALMQLDKETGNIRYSRAPYEDADVVWKWMYDETAKTSHVLTIDQPAARSFLPFKFQLREDYSTMSVFDHEGGPSFDDEAGDSMKRAA